MGNLPISGLPNLTASTNSSLIPIVASGVTYNINLLDLWKSVQPFGTMYQDWIPDAPSAHTIGSITLPLKSIYVSTGSVFIGPGNSLAIDDSGVLYSTNVFAAPTFQVGNITSSGGVVSTSGYTFSVANNELIVQNNSGGTIYNLTDQVVPTGGTANQVLTRNTGTYGWGWSGLTASQIPTRYYGAFSSTGTQTSISANTVNVMSATTTEINNGVVLSANTKFVMQHAGVYNIQFSAQFQQQANIDSSISVWFRKNGTDVPRSNTDIAIDKNQAGPSKLVAAWNYVDSFNANDYIEIAWSSVDGTMQLFYQGTQTNPTRPSTPSLIVTVTQV
jgi:hypothetical protein